jgi:hypothetical protein
MPSRDWPHVGNGADAATRVRDLNDRFRSTFLGGKLVMTCGVADVDPTRIAVLLNRVRRFDIFTPDNDPRGEHDFGAFDDGGERFSGRSTITTGRWNSHRPTLPIPTSPCAFSRSCRPTSTEFHAIASSRT